MRPESTEVEARSPAPVDSCVEVAGWRFDPVAQSLTRGPEVRALGYRAAQVLWRLHQAGGKPVARSELLQFAWPGQRPTDVALSQVIVELRRALGESARMPRFLLTVPRVGYRLAVETSGKGEIAPQHEGGGVTGLAPSNWRWRVVLLGVLVLAVAVMVWRPTPPAPGAGVGVMPSAVPVPVAFSGDGERMPDLSHDGRRLVYALHRGAQLELHLQHLDGGEPRRITQGARDAWPRFSRDGQIAFLRTSAEGAQSELRVISEADAASRLITRAEFDGSMDWTPDSRAIVLGVRAAEGRVQPYRVDVASGAMQPLFAADQAVAAAWVGEPGFSPSGRQLLLRVGRFPASRLLLVDLHSGARRFLSEQARVVASHAWHDEGHLLLSAQHRGRNGLWSVGVEDGSWQHLRDEPLSRIAAAAGRLVFPRSATQLELVRFPLHGERLDYVARGAFDSYHPRFLGGTDAVLFLSLRSGSEQFWRIEDGQPESRVALLQEATVWAFDVTADGRALAVVQEDDEGLAVLRADLPDGRPQRIAMPDFQSLVALALLPGQEEMLVLGRLRSGAAGLFSVDPAGHAQQLVAGEDFEELQVSPQGVAFVARRDAPGYYRLDRAGGALHRVVEVAAQDLTRWRVTAEGIVHLGRDAPGAAYTFRLHPFAGGAAQRLRAWPTQIRAISFDVRDGEVIATTFDSIDVNLMLWDLPPPAVHAPR